MCQVPRLPFILSGGLTMPCSLESMVCTTALIFLDEQHPNGNIVFIWSYKYTELLYQFAAYPLFPVSAAEPSMILVPNLSDDSAEGRFCFLWAQNKLLEGVGGKHHLKWINCKISQQNACLRLESAEVS